MTGGGNRFRILFLMAWISILLRAHNALAGNALSTTPQGIFRLQCNNPSIARTGERLLSGVEKRFYEATRFEPQDYPPVLVQFHGHEFSLQGLPTLRVDALEGGQPRIQVDLLEEDVTKTGTLSGVLLVTSMILREYYMGKAPQVGSSIPKLPSWLSHGLASLCLDTANQKKPILASYLQGGAPPGIEAFLAERPPDAENHVLEVNYDARAESLLQAGLKGEGSDFFRKWVRANSSGDHLDSLGSSSTWPSGWPMQQVERRWLLQMATSSREEKSSIAELTFSESLRKYDAVAKAIPLDVPSFQKFRKEKGADFTFQGIYSKLSALRLQANPLVIPLIDSTLDLLKSGKSLSGKKLSERLAALISLRASILMRSQKIDSYLDWYEATKLPVCSGLFDELLKSPGTPVRKGPVGRYLDAVETRGW